MSQENPFGEKLLACLGGDWPEPCPLVAEHEETMAREGYRIERVSYQVEPGERVPAYVLIPEGVDSFSPAPGIGIYDPAAENGRAEGPAAETI